MTIFHPFNGGYNHSLRMLQLYIVDFFQLELVIFRYPTFIDAVRDLDDALSMLVLFSSMPQTDKIQVSYFFNCFSGCTNAVLKTCLQ